MGLALKEFFNGAFCVNTIKQFIQLYHVQPVILQCLIYLILKVHPYNNQIMEDSNNSADMRGFSMAEHSLYEKKREKEENDLVARMLRP